MRDPTSGRCVCNEGFMPSGAPGGLECIPIVPPPNGKMVGGEFIGIDSTMVLVAGTQFTAAWV